MLNPNALATTADLNNIILNIDIQPDDILQVMARTATQEFGNKLIQYCNYTYKELALAIIYYHDGVLSTLQRLNKMTERIATEKSGGGYKVLSNLINSVRIGK